MMIPLQTEDVLCAAAGVAAVIFHDELTCLASCTWKKLHSVGEPQQKDSKAVRFECPHSDSAVASHQIDDDEDSLSLHENDLVASVCSFPRKRTVSLEVQVDRESIINDHDNSEELDVSEHRSRVGSNEETLIIGTEWGFSSDSCLFGPDLGVDTRSEHRACRSSSLLSGDGRAVISTAALNVSKRLKEKLKHDHRYRRRKYVDATSISVQQLSSGRSLSLRRHHTDGSVRQRKPDKGQKAVRTFSCRPMRESDREILERLHHSTSGFKSLPY